MSKELDYIRDRVGYLITEAKAILKYIDEVNAEEMNNSKIKESEINNCPQTMEEYAQEIFRMCPICNCIPLCCEIEVETSFDRVVAPHEIYDTLQFDLSDEEGDLRMPYQYDNITFGDWEKIWNYWVQMIKMSKYEKEHEKLDDYCEFTHVSIQAFSKKTNKIEYFEDINR